MTEERLMLIVEEMRRNNVNKYIIAFVRLHFQSGARISDMLRINYTNISENLNITIEQGKGSNPIFVSPIWDREEWRRIRELKLSPFQNHTRHSFYRMYKKYGIIMNRGNGSYNSVTHFFRKNLAQDIMNETDNLELVAKRLGHKNQRNAIYYTKNRPKNARIDRGIINAGSGETDPVIQQKNGIIRLTRVTKKRK